METNRNALLTSIAALLSKGSTDELRAFHVIASRVMGGGRDQYGPLHLANDARNFRKEGADEMADYVWYVAIQAVLDGYPATSSASPNELTPAEGVAPFSSPSLGALSPSPSSSADSHGDTFLPPPDDRSTAVPHAVSGGGSFTNRLGRACTDCGAGDGDAHSMGCPWITEVTP